MNFLNDITVNNNVTAVGTIQSANLTLTGLSTGAYASMLVENAGVVYKRDLTLSLLPAGTEGQMLYNNAGTWTAFSGVFWDDTNSRLGVGLTSGLTAKLTTRGAGTTSSTFSFEAEDSAGTEVFRVRDDGVVSLRQRTPEATYGSELLTNPNFTSDLSGWTVGGADWTWVAGAATHAAGAATTMSQLTVSAATHYRVKFSITKTSGTSLTISFGGVNLVTHTGNNTASYVYDVLTSTTAGFVATPTSDFVGSFDTTSAAVYTGNALPALVLFHTDGTTVTNEIRSSVTSNSLAFGATSLQRADIASVNNVAIGPFSMALTYYGTYNTCIGSYSGQNLNNATSNVLIGYGAGQGITSGGSNVAIGYAAMYAGTTGSGSVAIGYNAARNAAASTYILAIGYNALYNTANHYNGGLGTNAGFSNTSGTQNHYYGFNSGYSAVSGSYNTGVGGYALYFPNAASSNNTAIGYQALYGATGNACSNNTSLGYRAGYVITTGSNNIFIGYNAGETHTSGSNNIVIGYDIDAPSGTTSNQLTLGNALFGVSIDGVGTGISTGRLGAFVAAPTARFHLVAGGTAANSAALKFTSGSTLTTAEAGAVEWDGTNLYLTQTSGPTRKTVAYTDNVSNVTVTNDTTTNATMYPLWVTASSGNLPVKVSSTKLSFNPSTGALAATSFSGSKNIESTNETNITNGFAGGVVYANYRGGSGAITAIRFCDGMAAGALVTVIGNVLQSAVATGTAPLIVASTTKVTNLNADLLDDMNPLSTNTASSIVARDASGNFSAGTITATLSGNATSATNATNIGITNDTTTGAVMYPVWVTTTSGNLPAKVSSTGISFNPLAKSLAISTTAPTSSVVSSFELAPALAVGGINDTNGRWGYVCGLVTGIPTHSSIQDTSGHESNFLAHWTFRSGTLATSATNGGVTVSTPDGVHTTYVSTGVNDMPDQAPAWATVNSNVIAAGVVVTFDFDTAVNGTNYQKLHTRGTAYEAFRPVVGWKSVQIGMPTNIKVTVSYSSDGTATTSTVFTDIILFDAAPTWYGERWVGPSSVIGGSANNWIRRVKFEFTLPTTTAVSDQGRVLYLGLLSNHPTGLDIPGTACRNRWCASQNYQDGVALRWESSGSAGPWTAKDHIWATGNNLHIRAPQTSGRVILGWDKSGTSTAVIAGVYESSLHKFRPESGSEDVQLGDGTYLWNGLYSKNSLAVRLPSSGSAGIYTYLTGDTQSRSALTDVGLYFGPGGATAFDTNLYRSAANALKTDDAFEAVGNLVGSGGFILCTSAGASSVQITGTDSRLIFYESDAAAEQKRHDFLNQANIFYGRFYNDAGSLASNWLTVQRNAATYTAGSIALAATNISFTGVTSNVGSFGVTGTTTLTGGASTSLVLSNSSSSPWAFQITRSDLSNTISMYNSNNVWYFNENVSAPVLVSRVAVGTAPLTVTSTTVVANLNADQLDGQHGSYYTGFTSSYVQSRLENLVTNGSGLLGNNTNFSGWTYDQVEVHGGLGSFKYTGTSSTKTTDEYIPVDPEKYYKLVVWAKAGGTGGNGYDAANRQYVGLVVYDIDLNSISPWHFMKYSGSTDTTLAVALNTGDSVVVLTDGTGWNTGGGATYQRQFSWWPYTNTKGYTYPDYTYSRNGTPNNGYFNTNGAWNARSTNTLTLTQTWPGPNLAAGTKVRNVSSGGTYKYITMSNVQVPNAWTRYEGTIGTYDTAGANSGNLFPYGTAYVRLLFLANYAGGASAIIRYSDLTFNEVDQRVPGTAALPAYSFATDFDTGMYQNGANSLGFSTGGTQRAILDSSGLTLNNIYASASRYISTVSTGTAPLTVSSSTVVTNLNADLLDGVQGANYSRLDVASDHTANFGGRNYLYFDAWNRTSGTYGTGSVGQWYHHTGGYVQFDRFDNWAATGTQAGNYRLKIPSSGIVDALDTSSTAQTKTGQLTLSNDADGIMYITGSTANTGCLLYGNVSGTGKVRLQKDGTIKGLSVEIRSGTDINGGSVVASISNAGVLAFVGGTCSGDLTVSAAKKVILGQQARLTFSYQNMQTVDSGSDRGGWLWNAYYDWSVPAYKFQNTNAQGSSMLHLGPTALTFYTKAGASTQDAQFTWDVGYTVLHSGNYNTYAPTLTGTGASGTWGISITGAAGSATNATNVAVTDDTATATTCYPTWVTGTSGNLPTKVTSSRFTFTPSTGLLDVYGISTSTHAVTLFAGSYQINVTSGMTHSGIYTNNIGGKAVEFTHATSNWIQWNTAGIGAPTFTTSSAGTKLMLYPMIGASNADYAIGMESGAMWFGVTTTSGSFKWYGGTTSMMVLNNSVLTIGGNTALHAGNYNSYAPTLTGTGASGTWGISVTGSAGSATTATNATNTAITDDTATAATMYLTWVTGTSGNLPQKVSSTKLTFNPSTGLLTVPNLTVTTTLTATVSNATNATNATNTAITDDTATATACYPTWVTSTSGNLPQKVASTKLTFVPSTGNLTAGGNISATGSMIATGANGGFIVTRRDTSASAWQWYSSAGSLELYDHVNASTKLTWTTGGVLTISSASTTFTGASGVTINGGATTLKAAAMGTAATYFAVFTGDPSTSGQAVNTRTASQVLSDIGAAASGHNHAGVYATTGAVTTSGLTMSTARLLGRTTAATGAIEEITVGTGLTFATTTLSVAYGTTASTACVGNDSRLSDARTPLAHTHSGADITSGTIGSAYISGAYGNITGTGALNSGSITSGFGSISSGGTIAANGAVSSTGAGAALYTDNRSNTAQKWAVYSSSGNLLFYYFNGTTGSDVFTLTSGGALSSTAGTFALQSWVSSGYSALGHTHAYTDVNNITTGRLLGRTTAGTGAAELISLANGTNCAATLTATTLTIAISSTPTFTDCTVTGRLNLPTSQPASPVNGSCYWDGSTNKFWVYSSTYGWKSVTLT